MPPQLSTMLTVVWCMAFKIESILWSALQEIPKIFHRTNEDFTGKRYLCYKP